MSWDDDDDWDDDWDEEPETTRRHRLITWLKPVLRIRSWRDAADLVMEDVDWSHVVMVRWASWDADATVGIRTIAATMEVPWQLLGGWPGHRAWPSMDDLIRRDLLALYRTTVAEIES